jgi:hypothetical protein
VTTLTLYWKGKIESISPRIRNEWHKGGTNFQQYNPILKYLKYTTRKFLAMIKVFSKVEGYKTCRFSMYQQ